MGKGAARTILASLFLVALVGAACGGDGPSKEDFLAEVNETCEEHRSRIEKEASQLLADGSPTPQKFMELANETIIPETEQQFETLAGIKPPADLADDFGTYVERGRETVEKMRQDPMLITDPASFDKLNRQADDLGLSDACHVGPQLER